MLKSIIFFILITCSILCNHSSINVYADSNYARAENPTYLYKFSTEDQSINNIYCLIEKGYFVKILDIVDSFYYVNYNGVSGFVKKNDVKEINETPQTPYPSNIKLVIGSNCNLRSSPTTNTPNNIIATLTSEESNIKFIGRIFSDEVIDFGGKTWYLVEFDGKLGYIYNKYVKSITPIYENQEKTTYKNQINYDISNPITNTPSLIIIIILLLPCIFILFLLYYHPKATNKRSKKLKEIDKY